VGEEIEEEEEEEGNEEGEQIESLYPKDTKN